MRSLSGRIGAAAVVFTLGAQPGPGQAASITVTFLTDENTNNADCSLREAIIAANTDANHNGCVFTGVYGDDTINLSSNGPYELTLNGDGEQDAATGDLDVKGNLFVQSAQGANPVIQASSLSPRDRVFEVHAGATVQMIGLTIQGGDLASGDGGGIQNAGDLTLSATLVKSNGHGGIANTGTLAITQNSEVSGNTNAGSGGGIYSTGGTLTLSSDSAVLSNT